MTSHAYFAPAVLALAAILFCAPGAAAQANSDEVQQLKEQVTQLRVLVADLETRLANLERRNGAELEQASYKDMGSGDASELAAAVVTLRAGSTPAQAAVSSQAVAPAAPSLPTGLPGGVTINYYFDGYFENNFNDPTGRRQRSTRL